MDDARQAVGAIGGRVGDALDAARRRAGAGRRSTSARRWWSAVFLGSRPTAGFSMEIVGAREEGAHARRVSTAKRGLAPAACAAQVLTSPYHIVAVPKHGGDVKFEKIN